MTGGFPAGRSENLAYVTLERPLTKELFHTVVRVGCESAKGKTNALDIFDMIWLKFQTRNIVRADTPEAPPMGYYRDESGNIEIFTVEDLLKNNDGRCGAWSNLLRVCLREQGIIDGRCVELKIKAPANIKSGMCIKNQDTSRGCSAVPIPLFGIAGQGTENPKEKNFQNHSIFFIDEKIYDPSYGTGPFSDIKEWQRTSLSAVGYIEYLNNMVIGRYFDINRGGNWFNRDFIINIREDLD